MTDLSEFGGGIDRSELDEADQFPPAFLTGFDPMP